LSFDKAMTCIGGGTAGAAVFGARDGHSTNKVSRLQRK
jgi:hypothetical protein